MKNRNYIKEIRQAEKEYQEFLEQVDPLEQKIMVKLSEIKTNCLSKNNLTNKFLRKK